MGGEGSGRKPDITNIYNQRNVIPPIATMDGAEFVLPNLSQIKTAETWTPGSVCFIGSNGKITQDNANLFWDDTNNRLGIGTASPGYPLDVEVNTNTDNSIALFNNQNTNASAYTSFYLGNNAATPYLQLRTSRATGIGEIGNPGNFPIKFFTNGVANTKMTILENGNVGIGTASPDYTLTVNGKTHLQDTTYVNDGKSIGAFNGNGARIFFNTTTGTTFYNTNGEVMRITDDNPGRVGIGTAVPASMLNVSGGYLQIQGAVTDPLVVANSNAGGIQTLRITPSGTLNQSQAGGQMSFGTLTSGTSTVNNGASIIGKASNTWAVGSNQAMDLYFNTNGTNVTSTERLRITSGGLMMSNSDVASPTVATSGAAFVSGGAYWFKGYAGTLTRLAPP